MSSPTPLEVRDLVLPLADDDRHVRRLHQLDPARVPGALELGQRVVLGPKLGEIGLPLLADEVVHPHRRRLVDRDDHRLAVEPAPDEVAHEIARDRPQPLGPADERDLAGEAPHEQALGLVVDLGLLEDLVQLLVERLVDELELGDPVLVEERNRRAVGDRVAEVVDRDVVAELPPRQLLADDERRPREAHERGFGQRRRACSGRARRTASGAPRR